jgi:DNA-binding NtrC family response regulator|tara:strand:- start:220 stop:594 length:375 start_codon:yes stop_codon:yes gene_type:complete
MMNDGKPHLLIVDDEADMRDELCSYFSDQGYRVTAAATGKEGSSTYDQDTADAVITDIRMPSGDGHQLIERLKSENSDLPIVVITGHDTFINKSTFVNDSRITVLKKPVGLREIEAALQSVLKA